jgi:signal transduction histidine kinase
MRTTVEVLMDGFEHFDPEKVQHYLRTILQGTEQLQAIVDHTAGTQRLASLEVQAVPIDLILERMRRLFEDDLRANGVSFSVTVPEPPAPTIDIDLIAAEEVLANVLRNAAKATARGGRIAVECIGEGDLVRIPVIDNGCGMDASQLDSVLQPLVGSKPEDLGIGLAYSSYLMKRLLGSIIIDSQIGQGTTVALTFARSGTANEAGRR